MKKSKCALAVVMGVLFLAGCSDSKPPKQGSDVLYRNLDGSMLKESTEPTPSGKNALFGNLEGSKLKRSGGEPVQNGQDK